MTPEDNKLGQHIDMIMCEMLPFIGDDSDLSEIRSVLSRNLTKYHDSFGYCKVEDKVCPSCGKSPILRNKTSSHCICGHYF